MFPTICATTVSLSDPAKVVDRPTMPARSSSAGIPSRAIELPGIMFATLGVSPVGPLGPNSYHPSPKVTNIPLDQISTPLLWNIWSVPFYQSVLKPLTILPPCRQHHSTQPVIKILLMSPTGPHNPLLCHHFCYYLKWVYDNGMFTIGDTLSSYGGLGEELNDLHSLRAIRC